MAKITVGNITKQISNNLYVCSQIRSIDAENWYMELFDTLPVYKYEITINRLDDEEDFDIFNKIFKDLVATGDFDVLNYEYNKEKSDDESRNGEYEIYATRFLVVSKTEPVMISCEFENIVVMSHLGTDKIEQVASKYLDGYNQEDDRPKCYVVVKEPDLYLDNFNIDLKNEMDFDLYNDGFEDVHNVIVNSIKNDKNGLYLLYGKPGTGKSTYIRHLIKECGTEKRKFVYIPSQLFDDFTDPGILPFLLRHKGCVFIIEDCESLVTVDDGMRSEGITDLLNMTDGLLADALNIKIICTFNTDYKKIDEALLRPGRCRCKYEFDLLKKNKANKVAEKLGLQKVDSDVSLAELFNPEITFNDTKKRKIGFN